MPVIGTRQGPLEDRRTAPINHWQIMFKSLDEIGIRFNTDKASRHVNKSGDPVRGNNYLVTYERFLSPFRHEPITLVEIGIGPEWNCGASLRTWLEFFTHPDAAIIGVDISAHAAQEFGPRSTALIDDATKPGRLLELVKQKRPHVIVDDGSHLWRHQIGSYELLFPHLREGGVYIIEDLGTSFGTLRDQYSAGADRDAFDYLATKAALLSGLGASHPLLANVSQDDQRFVSQIEFIAFSRQSAVIKKIGDPI
jgi:hypothetical protein